MKRKKQGTRSPEAQEILRVLGRIPGGKTVYGYIYSKGYQAGFRAASKPSEPSIPDQQPTPAAQRKEPVTLIEALKYAFGASEKNGKPKDNFR